MSDSDPDSGSDAPSDDDADDTAADGGREFGRGGATGWTSGATDPPPVTVPGGDHGPPALAAAPLGWVAWTLECADADAARRAARAVVGAVDPAAAGAPACADATAADLPDPPLGAALVRRRIASAVMEATGTAAPRAAGRRGRRVHAQVAVRPPGTDATGPAVPPSAGGPGPPPAAADRKWPPGHPAVATEWAAGGGWWAPGGPGPAAGGAASSGGGSESGRGGGDGDGGAAADAASAADPPAVGGPWRRGGPRDPLAAAPDWDRAAVALVDLGAAAVVGTRLLDGGGEPVATFRGTPERWGADVVTRLRDDHDFQFRIHGRRPPAFAPGLTFGTTD